MPAFGDSKASPEMLEALLASKARVAILRLLMLDPLRSYYQRQAEAVTGLPIRSVQRELDRLTLVGLLYRREEGNRAYYQVDTQFPLFEELRALVLKTATPEERLRGYAAVDESVRLAFLCESEARVLLVAAPGKQPGVPPVRGYAIEVMTTEEFCRELSDEPHALEAFLQRGVDLLARREDVIWRRVEAAGFAVKKGKGVA